MRVLKLFFATFISLNFVFFPADIEITNAKEIASPNFDNEILSSLSKEDTELFNQLDKYTILSEKEYQKIDVEQAIKDGASDNVIKVGNMINGIIEQNGQNTIENKEIDPYALLPIGSYGNYCGAGNKPGSSPIDNLDTACMHHDKCWNGVFGNNTTCNRQFVRRLLPIVQATTPVTYKGIYARAALKLFS